MRFEAKHSFHCPARSYTEIVGYKATRYETQSCHAARRHNTLWKTLRIRVVNVLWIKNRVLVYAFESLTAYLNLMNLFTVWLQ